MEAPHRDAMLAPSGSRSHTVGGRGRAHGNEAGEITIAIGTGRRNPGRDALALAPGPVGETREGTAALGLGPARRSVATGPRGGAPAPARRVASRAVSLCSKMDLLQYKHIHCLKDAQHK